MSQPPPPPYEQRPNQPPLPEGPPPTAPPPLPPLPPATPSSSKALKSCSHHLSTEERLKRRKTCRFIEEAGRILQLPRVATATGMVLFHRFFSKHSFDEHDRFEVAVACILLAAKTEESPKKLSHVILKCHQLKTRATDPGKGMLDPKGEEYLKLKERILLLERIILHTIGFELSIDHPYKFLVDQIKSLTGKRKVKYVDSKKDQSKMVNELLQMSMNFANDSMHSNLCLQFSAKFIAHACVFMSACYCKITLVNASPPLTWESALEVPVESLVSISEQILELISDRKGMNGNPNFADVKKNLESLKELKVSSSSSRSGGKRPAPPVGGVGGSTNTKRPNIG
eukprot:CAMPEP_0194356796 /NCGR_PEP_ID=MMETSP0174-20130528/4366_1 /TAXON_ID=216777 /ORGANISM="Proboscia alata, Strain PI-D3" /LENGTH=341 /DNA_ID=CAMNT_0039126531 /DNA_START=12 /DNA_END=1037 /DNA_ORIENTATION=-